MMDWLIKAPSERYLFDVGSFIIRNYLCCKGGRTRVPSNELLEFTPTSHFHKQRSLWHTELPDQGPRLRGLLTWHISHLATMWWNGSWLCARTTMHHIRHRRSTRSGKNLYCLCCMIVHAPSSAWTVLHCCWTWYAGCKSACRRGYNMNNWLFHYGLMFQKV